MTLPNVLTAKRYVLPIPGGAADEQVPVAHKPNSLKPILKKTTITLSHYNINTINTHDIVENENDNEVDMLITTEKQVAVLCVYLLKLQEFYWDMH